MPAPRVAVVVPSWNGLRWLPGLFASLDAQTRRADELVVVDNGSTDGTLAWLAERAAAGPVAGAELRVLEQGRNTGFAVAVNRGIAAVSAETVALLNTDVELAPEWLERAAGRLEGDPGLASVATKLVLLDDRSLIDDAGDVLRRDGAAEQRGHGRPDGPRFSAAGEVWAASAGAAVVRRSAVLAVGGFDERFFAYMEDVDLGLRLRLAGWRCAYEPVVARHARHGSSGAPGAPSAPAIDALVVRNTLVLVAKAFPARWLPLVAYRQASWARAAARDRRLGAYVRAVASAMPLVARIVAGGERRALRRGAVVPVGAAVPARPWRGRSAGGHPEAPE